MRRTFLALPLIVASLASHGAAQSAFIEIGPTGQGLKASTYGTGSFVIQNTSATDRITSVRFDFSTAILPDLVFDPDGLAGDVVGKVFTADSGSSATGLVGHSYSSPHDLGWDILDVTFDDFDPGETFTFSVDVDPTTIQGSAGPGPGESGSVSGLELTGTTVTIDYESSASLTARTFRSAGSQSASEISLGTTPAPAPSIQVLGKTTPANVTTTDWTVRVTGTPGATVTLLQLEGGLHLSGLPGGGLDVDPFEANTALAVSETSVALDGTGSADVSVTLTQSDPEGGIVHLYAVEQNGSGVPGDGSTVEILDYEAINLAFNKSVLSGASLNNPTSLQFGPDGRLYVAEQYGAIQVFTLTQSGPTYAVSATETITLVQDIPNHDDDGTPNPIITQRQITGLLVTGTPSQPVLYVSSSDPRIGAGSSGTDTGLDTNSGIVSKLTLTPGGWVKQDVVRGLPRSEENHSVNGMQLDETTNMLYLAVGGNTNMGAPSNNFALLPEFALSAAILSIDLDAIGTSTYDLPTLDDEDRPGSSDLNDPFGGNNGKNQARLVAGGPVQIHSSGWRNAYDVVLTEAGRMYSVDNGPNAGWGDIPSSCGNAISEPGVTHQDGLHFIPGPGYYAGHPNPTRASLATTFNPTNPQPAVDFENPVECTYLTPGVDDGALTTWGSSTNGICEYTASAFNGALQGDLLTISLNQALRRVKLSDNGDFAVHIEDLFVSVGSGSLDVTAQGDGDVFPGTIWVANRGNDTVVAFTPIGGGSCSGIDDPVLDEDLDGYTNADEIDNGTDPCSPADYPADWDLDGVSDLNDSDDDNDGLPDTSDRFALDADNGTSNVLPVQLLWDNQQGLLGGILDLGFTGLMTNGFSDYSALFDPLNMTAGGAAGAVTVDAVASGTADGSFDDLEYGFQVGMRVTPNLGRFQVRTSILGPYNGMVPDPDWAAGMFIGPGDQSDFARLVLTSTGTEYYSEVGSTPSALLSRSLPLPGPGVVDLFLEVDPALSTVTPYVQVDGGSIDPLSGPMTIPSGWTDGTQSLAMGLYSTSGAGAPFPATWDLLEAVPLGVLPVELRLNTGGSTVTATDLQPDWLADGGFYTGTTGTYSTSSSISFDASVPATVPEEVFQTERYATGSTDMTFEIPASSGQEYLVRLYFAEIWSGGQSAGARVFDVDLEGVTVLDDYDIYADVGGYTGVAKSFVVDLLDDSISVTLSKVVQNPKISAIEIVDLDGGALTPGAKLQYGLGAGGANLGLLDSLEIPTIGNPLTFQATSMGPVSAGIVGVNIQPATLPLFGGTILVDPGKAIYPFSVSGGTGTFPTTIPNDPVLIGRKLYCQAAGPDPSQPAGWRFTNGLELTFGG